MHSEPLLYDLLILCVIINHEVIKSVLKLRKEFGVIQENKLLEYFDIGPISTFLLFYPIFGISKNYNDFFYLLPNVGS